MSVASARSVMAAIDRERFEVVPVAIARSGAWLTAEETRAALARVEGQNLATVQVEGEGLLARPAVLGLLSEVDIAFPVMHGTQGEDGSIQGLFELAGVPYVGAGVFASAAAMDKEFANKLAAADGIPVGPYAVLRAGQSLSAADRDRLGLPVFVKPSRAGSSIGISKVHDWAQLDAAVAAARKVDPKVLVEAAIVGREIECGVLEGEHGGPPEASVCGEIRIISGHEFYDFEAKYLDDVCEFDIPADLPAEVSRRVRELAVKAFVGLDCAGLARVDFFVTADNRVLLNEINTMPGFTSRSMFPVMWAATGLDYPKLVNRLIRTALRRGTGLH